MSIRSSLARVLCLFVLGLFGCGQNAPVAPVGTSTQTTAAEPKRVDPITKEPLAGPRTAYEEER